jgi:hypothetical protein
MYLARFAKSTTNLLVPLLLAMSFLCSHWVQGQATTGSILGTITDSTGAVIPNAKISVTDIDRGIEKTALTNNVGAYRIDFLLAGNYKVSVSAPGFKAYVQSGIVLNAGVFVSVNAELSPGAVDQVVQVTSNAPLIETSNSELGTTVDRQQMTDLPLVNRNAYTLLDLTPGVQSNTVVQSFGAPSQVAIINGGVNNGSGSTNYFLDGAPNLNQLRTQGGGIPNPDALQEFRVQTSNYGATDGRYPNGIVTALVRSGTNTIHSTLFEFVRNPHLNAQPWGALATAPKEPLHRNQFGATLGGPIRKNKTFFFGSYAGLRQTDATLLSGSIVPTTLERTGDFTQSVGQLPIDPLTGTNFVCNGVTNVICDNRIDPVAKALLKYVPAGNTTINSSAGSRASWTGYSPAPTTQDEFLIKVNHVLSPKHSLYATYFQTVGNLSAISASYVASGLIYPYSSMLQTWRQQNSIINESWLISPQVVNNIWLSYVRMRNNRANLPAISLGDLGSTFAIQGLKNLPQLTISGYWNMWDANAGPGGTDSYSLRDIAVWTRGKHTLQFGGEFFEDKATKAAQLNNSGIGTFTGVMTKNAYGDFLLGILSSFQQDSPAYTSTTTFTYAAFLQDDFRITPRLTLNLGLRYDVQTPPVEHADHNVTLIVGQQSTRFPLAPKGAVFPGDAGVPRGITPIRYGHISPRVGFAYSPGKSQKTSIRGGAGLFWGSVSEELWTLGGNGTPFALAYSFPNASSLNGTTLSDPYRGGVNPYPNTGGLFPFGTSLGGISKDSEWPETVQANFSVQQQLTQNLGVTVAYVGSFGMNQGLGVDQNYPSANTNYAASLGVAQCGSSATLTPSTSNVPCRRPLAPLGAVSPVQTIFHTNYNGFQISVTQRLAHHVSANGYYTWSKAISDVPMQGGTPGGAIQNVNNIRAERARTANDLTHQAVFTINWQPELATDNRVVKAIVNGWQITPLVRLHSGAPFGITNGVDANLDGSSSSDRAQLTGQSIKGPKTVSQWFNTAAFAQNPAVAGSPVDGNSSPYIINSPAYRNLDLTLARTIPIHDRISFQFRAEASNAFNIVSHTAPGATVKSGTFGVITGANTMRQIQIGGKLNF